MQFRELSRKRSCFIVTPNELRTVFEGFHLVEMSTGVEDDYVESDPEVFFSAYDSLYKKLKNGDKLVWKNDYDIAYFSTGITDHLENCIYKPTIGLKVPNFNEPCPLVDTFCFFLCNDQLTTSVCVFQFPENVCGLSLYFPLKVEYELDSEKHLRGIVECVDLDDYITYETLNKRIRSITSPLKLDVGGRVRRTSVRVSDSAKKDLASFHFFTSNGISIL